MAIILNTRGIEPDLVGFETMLQKRAGQHLEGARARSYRKHLLGIEARHGQFARDARHCETSCWLAGSIS
jgi:hypothetical protein